MGGGGVNPQSLDSPIAMQLIARGDVELYL